MVKTQYYEMARQCVDEFYKDCEFVDVVFSNQIFKEDTRRNLTIKKADYVIPCSRTSKVVLRDHKKCATCNLHAKYAIVMRNINSTRMALCFVGEVDGKFIPLTKDHILAKMYGGRDTLKNLQTMCYPCNQNKAHGFVDDANNGMITITLDEYNRLVKKQSDFAASRTLIKKAINKMPWYINIFGAKSYLFSRIMQPIIRMGYYGENISKGGKK